MNPNPTPKEAVQGKLESSSASSNELIRLKSLAASQAKEVLMLRTALIETGRALGCFLTDTVSTTFLCGLPEETKLKMKRLSQPDSPEVSE